MYNEIGLDFSKMPKQHGPFTEELGTRKISRDTHRGPNSVYQRRKSWWMSKGYGEKPAEWAASWRLGAWVDKSGKEHFYDNFQPGIEWDDRTIKPGAKIVRSEKQWSSLYYAYQTALGREDRLRGDMRELNITREQAIIHRDERLKAISKQDNDKAEYNIFKDTSL